MTGLRSRREFLCQTVGSEHPRGVVKPSGMLLGSADQGVCNDDGAEKTAQGERTEERSDAVEAIEFVVRSAVSSLRRWICKKRKLGVGPNTVYLNLSGDGRSWCKKLLRTNL